MTAELSLYPLRESYVEAIRAFIEAAREAQSTHDITIVSNAMSTQVCGDYDTVMALIGRELRNSYQRYGRQVLVCKLIPGELDIAGE